MLLKKKAVRKNSIAIRLCYRKLTLNSDYFSNNPKRLVYLMSLPIFDLFMSHKNTSVVDPFRMNTYAVGLGFPKKTQSGSGVPRNFVRRGGGGGSTN
jgi:hypothetical protein